jgi:hypothetical protein
LFALHESGVCFLAVLAGLFYHAVRHRFPRDVSVAALANVGHRAFEIAAGDSKRVKVRLKRRARRLVKEKGRVRARVIVVVEDAAGNTRKLRDRLPLLAPQ